MRLASEWTPRSFYLTALMIGAVYLCVSPVFSVLDESAHFWRALAVAHGRITPAPRPGPVAITVDSSRLDFAWHVHDQLERTGRFDLGNMRMIAQLRWRGDTRVAPVVVPLYTPVPYIPQAVVSAAAEIARLRPLLTFYLGRVANLSVWLLVVAVAIRLAPQCAPIFATIALLPTSLYLFASWSGDAGGIALAILFTSLIVRASTQSGPLGVWEITRLAFTALLLTLCKPPYALLTALTALIPTTRFGGRKRAMAAVTLVMLLAIGGTFASTTWFNSTYVNMRPDLPVDPAAQVKCIVSAPGRFAVVILSDVHSHASLYLSEAIGLLGRNEIALPRAAVTLGFIVLAVVAVTTRTGVQLPLRLGAILISIVISLGIVVSQYLIWSIVCADEVEGVTGRYFLPILPLAMIGTGGFLKWRVPAVAQLMAALLLNGAAIATLLLWYW